MRDRENDLYKIYQQEIHSSSYVGTREKYDEYTSSSVSMNIFPLSDIEEYAKSNEDGWFYAD